ncbi:UDP-N-acetylmuramoyl-tripeptide--D-alanyl-D-alanine ligase [Thermomonas flagellata]|uniref:UDP-N-acetylmuramoyl-tripeptide--D-alanyl-D- alanine ligase n=1 Tax=Thermomonas flagellata TaxID=2888524 RepID=UPI001F04690B|nr:UDP-N-acetylmuramoyl-tripeptide--D-alanyl-D-alanine ligase [Thermomonas flagellata]
MTPRLLAWIAAATGGRLHGADRTVDAVATDTRALPVAGAPLFVALAGERFDGHAHLAAAAAGGCVAALVARPQASDLPQVVVADTRRALADLARAVQRERTRTRVVAITGSNGKTSVKTLTAAVLARAGRVYATPGNRNNEIGLPLAVLEAPEDADFAVYEMGAGAPGDIAYLTAVAPPDVGLVNNIGPAHLERMGSLLGIAATKAAVYADLRPGGTAVINADDAFAAYFAAQAGDHARLRFGLDSDAEVGARALVLEGAGSRFVLVTPAGEAAVALALPGRHNVRNALAAAAIGHALGLAPEQIAAGLGDARPVAGRQQQHRLPGGAWLIDDSYNANPASLAAGVEALVAAGGEPWLVLGDMRELGSDEVALHAQAGAHAKAAGVVRLFALGALSAHAAAAFGAGAQVYPDHAALAQALQQALHPGVRVLVKGSRGSAMDRIVTALLERQPATGEGGSHAA